MRQEEEERQTEFYRVLGRLLDQMIQKRRRKSGAAVWMRRSAATSRAGEKQRRRWSRKENGRKQNGAIGTMGKSDRKKKNACERRSFWNHAEIRLILQPDNR